MRQFFMVWSPAGLYAPKYRHDTREAAKKEAERLAQACPGQEFYVLGAYSRACIPPITESLEGAPREDEDIPF